MGLQDSESFAPICRLQYASRQQVQLYRLDTSAVTLSPKRSVKLIKPQTGCPLRGQVLLRSRGAQQTSQGLSKTIPTFISARRLGPGFMYCVLARTTS